MYAYADTVLCEKEQKFLRKLLDDQNRKGADYYSLMKQTITDIGTAEAGGKPKVKNSTLMI